MENHTQEHNHHIQQAPEAARVTPQTQLSPRHYVRPRASIAESGSVYVVQVEMPGVSRDGLEITFENNELTLLGHRTPFHTDAELVYRESRPMDFRRVFELDPSIDAAGIGAQLDQGLLTLNLPKSAAAQPRRINVAGLN